jgi:pyrroloquinoline-quinone synthase
MPLSVTKIEEEIEERSLLKHPFYRMWSGGKLTLDQLAGYSKEYYQLVKAVPKLVANVGTLTNDPSVKSRIHENLEEELTHIEPWVMFSGALGVSRSELDSHAGARCTLDSVGELDRLTRSSFLEGVAAMYAYEKQLPGISRSKIEGLKMHYGLHGGDATRYLAARGGRR